MIQKIILTQNSYTITDFTVVLLNAVSFEAITQNGERTQQFIKVRNKIENILLKTAIVLNENERKQLFSKEDFEKVLHNKKFLALLEDLTGNELRFEVTNSVSNSIQLNQSNYTITNFALIVFNCLGVQIRKQSGQETPSLTSTKRHLRKMLHTSPNKTHSRGELIKTLDELILWVVSNKYCDMPIFDQAKSDIYNNVRNAIIDIFNSDDKEIIKCIQSAIKRWKI